MSRNCPICQETTVLERAIRGGGKTEIHYVCENCAIAWVVGKNNKMHIAVSSTHSRASKMNDEEFAELTKRIAEYETSENNRP